MLVDVLPDGTTYVDGSASIAPRSIEANTPAAGQTTITWDLPPGDTTPGKAGGITFRARVDDVYESGTLAGQPVVSGDVLTNQVSNAGEWQDAVDTVRLGTLTPNVSRASVRMRMPTFDKVVRDPITSAWGRSANAFVGDTLTFKLNYASAADVDAKAIVIRDFLPRGMTYVDGSAQHVVNGNFADGPGCTATPQTPSTGTLNGLQYLEWRLCNAARGATWQATIQAKVGPMPTIQPGWIVANFGKLSGQNSYADAYSLRAMANTNYVAPRLFLDKIAAPSSNLKAGSVVNYTIKVTNLGGATAYNLLVQDTLPVSLTVANAGGSATPIAATYGAVAGNPAAGQGGELQWSPIASLAPGQVETFKYTATIPAGLPAGASLKNLASVSYNSRSDNQGHQVNWSATLADDQTDDAIVYIKGFTIVKKALSTGATIGDTVRWVMTVTVPSGVKGFWPVVEENDLPPGFDYKPNSTVIKGATLDNAHHAANPKDDGIADLRWFFDSIDNSASGTDKTFTVQFDTLVTGVKGNAPSVVYYPNNWTTTPTTNTVRVCWYDKITG
ncbi:MAG: DUF11 domain-containing protein [Anaerolineales bacterium]|nr:DUF11 domain-containing protein [Anaerolineales bacterium]